MNVAINGFGRIGRMAFRAIKDYHTELNVVAIRDPASPETLAHLLRRDSIYGRFEGTIEHSHDCLTVDGKRISCDGQPLMTWWAQGVDVVLECSGGGPDGNKARRHLDLGAKRVIISAPAPNVDAIIIMGVNEDTYDPQKHQILSMGSCTANCVAPIVKAVDKHFAQVYSVRVETLNAYTNSQRLVDAPHRDRRMTAAAGLNVIPSESSALPVLRSLFPGIEITGRAYRVPVACGSMAALTLRIGLPYQAGTTNYKPENPDVVNAALRKAASPVLCFAQEPMVSSDVIGEPYSAMIDGSCTEVRGADVHLLAFFDNEYGFSCRLADLAAHIGKTIR